MKLNETTDPNSREAKMVVLERDESGKATIFCDPEIVDLVKALNDGGVPTTASCSGHGERNGSIALRDGRCLIITPSLEEHNRLYKVAGQLVTDSDDATKPVENAPSPLLESIHRQLEAELLDALDNHKRTLDYIVKDHAPRNATNYEVYLKKAIEVDVKIAKLLKPGGEK